MKTATQTPTWLDRKLYPFKPNYLTLSGGEMHYLDEGSGDTILFVHGTPTWSFLYRKFVKTLSSNFRCIAVDHIGFGLSGKPESFIGTPENHAKNLVEFIEKMNLTNVTLVLHDFGGSIGLSAAIELHKRIKNIVLFNSFMWETKHIEEILKIDKTIRGGIGKFLYLNMNFSPKVLLKKGFTDTTKLSKNVHKHYIKPFPNKKSRLPLYEFAKALIGSSDWFQEQWEQLDVLAQKRWLILWGMKDQFITEKYLSKWSQQLPNAEITKLDCGHFVQEEKPDEAIAAIRSFLVS